jgi:hypothetical protein
MGLLVFITVFRLIDGTDRAAPTGARVAPAIEPTLAFDFTVDKPRAQPSIDPDLELRDNTASGDWSRAQDYELAATLGPFTFACNHHFILRNIGEAQVVASYTIEY